MAAGDKIQCFLLEPTRYVRRQLRRYSRDDRTCSLRGGSGYHNAMAPLDEISIPLDDDRRVSGDNHDHADPRWPKTCGCGYVFTPGDHWQVFVDTIYRRIDTNEKMTLANAPAGAMWYAEWMTEGRTDDGTPGNFFGPDGKCLIVRVPGGDWNVDGPSFNNGERGQGWTREGTPPLVTARPSILKGAQGEPGYYHGFLTSGELISCD